MEGLHDYWPGPSLKPDAIHTLSASWEYERGRPTPSASLGVSAGVLPLEAGETTFDLDQFVQNDDVSLLRIDTNGTRLATDEFSDLVINIILDIDLHEMDLLSECVAPAVVATCACL